MSVPTEGPWEHGLYVLRNGTADGTYASNGMLRPTSVKAAFDLTGAAVDAAAGAAEEALSTALRDDGGKDLSVVTLDEQQRRTWLEAGVDGGPTSHAANQIGVIQEDRDDYGLLAVTDGEKVVEVVARDGGLGGTLLRYTGKGVGAIPARAGGVMGDAVVARHVGTRTIVPTSGRDDTSRLQGLLDSVGSDGGGTVVLDGASIVSGGLNIPANVSLRGTSRRSASLTLADAANPAYIISLDGNRTGVANLSIYGNAYRQTYPGVRVPMAGVASPSSGVTGSAIRCNPSTTADDTLGTNIASDKYLHVADVAIFDAWGAGVWGYGSLGESRFTNVLAQRCGIGFLLPPDSFAIGCTAAEPEFHGFVIQHGSGHYSACKAFRAGAFVRTDLTDQPVAYIRRTAAGWYVQGSGSNSIVDGCSAQNCGGPGLEIAVGNAPMNVSMILDGNNLIAQRDETGAPMWSQLPWDRVVTRTGAGESGINALSKYGPDRVSEGVKIDAADIPGAVIKGAGHQMRLTSNTASFQSADTPVGWQAHAVDLSGATGCDIHVGHSSQAFKQDGATRPALAPIKPGHTPGSNRVTANGAVIDERLT